MPFLTNFQVFGVFNCNAIHLHSRGERKKNLPIVKVGLKSCLTFPLRPFMSNRPLKKTTRHICHECRGWKKISDECRKTAHAKTISRAGRPLYGERAALPSHYNHPSNTGRHARVEYNSNSLWRCSRLVDLQSGLHPFVDRKRNGYQRCDLEVSNAQSNKESTHSLCYVQTPSRFQHADKRLGV